MAVAAASRAPCLTSRCLWLPPRLGPAPLCDEAGSPPRGSGRLGRGRHDAPGLDLDPPYILSCSVARPAAVALPLLLLAPFCSLQVMAP